MAIYQNETDVPVTVALAENVSALIPYSTYGIDVEYMIENTGSRTLFVTKTASVDPAAAIRQVEAGKSETLVLDGPVYLFSTTGGSARVAYRTASTYGSGLVATGARYVKSGFDGRTLPGDLGWDSATFPVQITLSDQGGVGPTIGSAGISPEAMFDRFSTARTTTASVFYVNAGLGAFFGGYAFGTGSDSNGGSMAAPFASIWKAVQAANAANVPTKIMVAAGTYYRAGNPSSGITLPGVDMAFVAVGGTVLTGTFDASYSFVLDTGQTYVWSRSNVDGVYDLTRTDGWGKPVRLIKATSQAACEATPDSFYYSGSSLYVHRLDGAAPTVANTRVTLGAVDSFALTAGVNVYIGGSTPADGWVVMGGQGVRVDGATTPASAKVFVCNNVQSLFAGGLTGTGYRGFSLDNWRGLIYLYGCRAGGNVTDGFNLHDGSGRGSAGSYLLTVNCSAEDNGWGPSTGSNNGWTTHEDVVGIDIAGFYENNRGGSVRSVGSSKAAFFGTMVRNDLGDQMFGGSIPPTAFMVGSSAQYWLDSCKADMPSGTRAYFSENIGATIFLRNTWPTRGTSNTDQSWAMDVAIDAPVSVG